MATWIWLHFLATLIAFVNTHFNSLNGLIWDHWSANRTSSACSGRAVLHRLAICCLEKRWRFGEHGRWETVVRQQGWEVVSPIEAYGPGNLLGGRPKVAFEFVFAVSINWLKSSLISYTTLV
ncbi:hypothetical protein M433DRAFT_9443 [Acidomyces richmondensis BFW]|nr:MAG: hypothetical protein FE78DRAFT_324423 [Acidomyces sp. 'richmondensis']KYG39997.1 hypothetical protein M433DRAFT_9443 [Acidomyces richmondensis BFW]